MSWFLFLDCFSSDLFSPRFKGNGSMASILPFLYYSFVAGITPGPANICSLSTAIRKGRKAALLQWRGLFLGYMTISVASSFITWLIGTAFQKYVRLFTFVGAAYILYLAFHVLTDQEDPTKECVKTTNQKSLQDGTFLFGFLLQLTNVKIIIFCLSALTGYILPYRSDLLSLLAVGFLLPFTGPICNLVWLFSGVKLSRFYTGHRKIVNAIMAFSLFFCAVSMLLE